MAQIQVAGHSEEPSLQIGIFSKRFGARSQADPGFLQQIIRNVPSPAHAKEEGKQTSSKSLEDLVKCRDIASSQTVYKLPIARTFHIDHNVSNERM
jgi:hypothetical protein